MNPASNADQIWTAVLPEIRAARRRRRTRRVVAGSAAVCLLAWWLLPRPVPTTMPAPVVRAPVPPPPVEHLAVYRVTDDGSLRLVAVASDELGATELNLGLTPVVLNESLQDW